MMSRIRPGDPGFVACDGCGAELARSEAFIPEGLDGTAHFCAMECYEAWRSRLAAEEERYAAPARAPGEPQPAAPAQLGRDDRGPALDEDIKRLMRRHPQRDEPKW
jgi:Domain of unknown function (DUF3330)